MVNYYDLLGVSQDADRATIEQAIKKTRRLWNNRANNPDARSCGSRKNTSE